ncbi:serine/threonine-protein kinase [Tahibacter amnicola]|uniref:Serine/threonine protein kinase n=1 Tax=Tahibacter amnicola TaxID=2976241 RepID=A0ABY6BK25_9GAMM|nr:serine/threonine-protein kinase [Tahibacter amnicola]UXI70112.1 serine/threonine protein kinase [Tahibacter amnicola]
MSAPDDPRTQRTLHAAATDWTSVARLGVEEADPDHLLGESLDLADPDERRFGDFELLERLGRGGMGVVFRARQVSLDRQVAVKFVTTRMAGDERTINRFREEARIAARLHHPHIVAIYEVGATDGLHYFSMPLLRGGTLAARLAAAPMPARLAVEVITAVASAVEYAHSLQLLHLDLKPANVLFNDQGQPMVADFGLARVMGSGGGVLAQECAGTPGYMAPEQSRPGAFLDACTDIYALGAILYEMLGGVAPRRTDTPSAPTLAGGIAGMALSQRVAGTLDRDLAAICERCLQPDPERRYATVGALRADLSRWQDGTAVSVRARRWPERAWRSVRRNRLVTLVTAVAIAALIGGLAATLWQWRRAETARIAAHESQLQTHQESRRVAHLSGLLAAAFPAGAGEERERSARRSVAWLKQALRGDAAAQGEVLARFREALTAAGNGDAVNDLVSQIAAQLGEDYRRTQIDTLAGSSDRDHWIAAALIGIATAREAGNGDAYETVLSRLSDERGNELALYVAALACHAQHHPCRHPEYRERLIRHFPDNAIHWFLLPRGEKRSDAALANVILQAAKASRADDHLPDIVRILRPVVGREPLPSSIARPLHGMTGEADIERWFRRYAINNVPLPAYGDVARLCKPGDPIHRAVPALRDACGTLGQRLMQSDASILARMIGSVILRRLYKGRPQEAQALAFRRQYVWLGEHVRDDLVTSERLQQDVTAVGEWEALQRQADYLGVARTPPDAWHPVNPQVLLLPEERAPAP